MVACEHEEGDVYEMAARVAEELDRAHKEQERLQDELEFTSESIVTASKEFTSSWALHNAACENVNETSANLNGAFREVSNRRATHEAVCAEVKRACQRTSECKRKAMEAHESVVSDKERTKRVTNEHTRAEAAHSLGNLGCCVKEAAAATHSLTCGYRNRERDEIHYLKQATELIEEWQKQLQGVPPVSRPSSEHGEVVLIECQRRVSSLRILKGDTLASCQP